MPQNSNEFPYNAPQVLVESFSVNEACHQIVLKHLDSRAWQAKPPGQSSRTIAGIFSHLHNIRIKWIRLSAPHLKLPARLDRTHCTRKQAASALSSSASLCQDLLTEALIRHSSRVKQFHRDGWARRWPVGVSMVAYMLTHEAHHRGQVCLLAHQLGFPLPVKATVEMWTWEKLWKQCGAAGPR